jgi:short-subunit dehydrogenase
VNVASAAGLISTAEMAPYNATKAAVISLSETLRSELAPYSIGVTVLCPTFVKTHLLDRMRFTDEFQRHCSTTGIDNARWTAEKVAALVVDAVKREKMYVVPQTAAKLFWLSKRISPSAYVGGLAFLMRMGWGRRLMFQLARRGF